MATSNPWDDLPAETRRGLINSRLINAKTQIYNLHLNELEGQTINQADYDRFNSTITALEAELDSLPAT